MQLYRYLYISLILIVICNMTITSRKIQNQDTVLPTPNLSHKASEGTQKKHTIIIDLTNVLFKENHNEFAKKLGYGTLASYAITHWKSPGHRCLDMLAEISKEQSQTPHVTITLKGRQMPKCIVELQQGVKNCSHVQSEINQCVATLDKTKFFSSDKEKNLMLAIMNLILDPSTLASMIEPIKQTVQLVQKLKIAGHPLYLFANVPEELYSSIQITYPDIIKLFNGVVISSHIKQVKPEQSMFEHLLTTHNLNPCDCIIIDDLDATVAVAQKLGMNGIVYDKISHVTNKLRKCGIKI